MKSHNLIPVDGNEAAADVAYRLSEMVALYPITPASAMGELADEWAARGRENLFGSIPRVVEMQSEAGAIGAVHGGLQAGVLCTTFTASQGLLLMIPNMYKIAGELTPFVMHVAARSLATHALSIFGDHSDVMACRQTGFAMLASSSVQEAHDQAAIATAATLKSRVPFVHFFDGFRTSHEINCIEPLQDEHLRLFVNQADIAAHRARGLTPDKPVLRGTAQNPDVFFQAREAANPFYQSLGVLIESQMQRFAEITGRRYQPYQYVGSPDATNVIIAMGSGAQTVAQTVRWLNSQGQSCGCVIVRMYRPFAGSMFVGVLPPTVKRIAVLDRCKEPGSLGEPLYQDVLTSLIEARDSGLVPEIPLVSGGRYGLSSKEFTPAMVRAIFDELSRSEPRRHFTVGIVDDVTRLSLPVQESLDIEPADTFRALFYGLGSDGTVGANKNSIKIIAQETGRSAQAYFVYDSKKSGALTVSHLRFGPTAICAPYLIEQADFIACHQFEFLEKMDIVEHLKPGGVVLLNAPWSPQDLWPHLPLEVQEALIARRARVFAIDAGAVAREAGMGRRINTIMQTCFFAISGVLARDEAIAAIKRAISKTYAKRGDEVVRRNFAAVDAALAQLHEIALPAQADSTFHQTGYFQQAMPEFTARVQAVMMAGKGDSLPVSAFPVDGTWPTGTTRWEKRNIAEEIPVWDPTLCIQCNKCSFVCPHAAIRAKVCVSEDLAGAPAEFLTAAYKAPDFKGMRYVLQVAPEDCTGCGLCIQICPAKDKANPRVKAIGAMPRLNVLDREKSRYDFFLSLPEVDRTAITRLDAKSSQFMLPLFEYSGACAGCGETPYIKLLTQLFGDRLVIANATGCSSIYSGNLPTTPYAHDAKGRGPAWNNSLFEDNAEFGLGLAMGTGARTSQARRLLQELTPVLGHAIVNEMLSAPQATEADIVQQRDRVEQLRQRLKTVAEPAARLLETFADYLLEKSVWIIGGDGWAYDIGYGGLDHVLSLSEKVRILVLDTEVYSNTGGQSSKSTPIGAAAKFAALGKATQKKDLGLMAMSYRHAYVASVAFGANDNQTVKAFAEANAFPGPAIIIAYAHCIAHGYDLRFGCEQQKLAVDSGIWPLYRYDPRLIGQGKPPLQIDSPVVRAAVSDYLRNETRFAMVEKIDPKRFHELGQAAARNTTERLALYHELARIAYPAGSNCSNTDEKAIKEGAPS